MRDCPHCLGNKGNNEGLCKKHFSQLQKQWYDVVAATGFKDAEKDGELIDHSQSANRTAKKFDATRAQARQDYYRQAGFFLYDYSFSNETELEIWKAHANGMAIRDITKMILAKNPKNYKKTMVHVTIQKLSKIMRRLYLNG